MPCAASPAKSFRRALAPSLAVSAKSRNAFMIRASAFRKKALSSIPERSNTPCGDLGSIPGRNPVVRPCSTNCSRARCSAAEMPSSIRNNMPSSAARRLSATICLKRSRSRGGSSRSANSSTRTASPCIGSATTMCVRWMRGRSPAAMQSSFHARCARSQSASAAI